MLIHDCQQCPMKSLGAADLSWMPPEQELIYGVGTEVLTVISSQLQSMDVPQRDAAELCRNLVFFQKGNVHIV